jgi:hypothetical protein
MRSCSAGIILDLGSQRERNIETSKTAALQRFKQLAGTK